jgi:hypothetical protein
MTDFLSTLCAILLGTFVSDRLAVWLKGRRLRNMTQKERVLAELKQADELLAKYLGPMHPVRKELRAVRDEL